jgi:hypothetical protein
VLIVAPAFLPFKRSFEDDQRVGGDGTPDPAARTNSGLMSISATRSAWSAINEETARQRIGERVDVERRLAAESGKHALPLIEPIICSRKRHRNGAKPGDVLSSSSV